MYTLLKVLRFILDICIYAHTHTCGCGPKQRPKALLGRVPITRTQTRDSHSQIRDPYYTLRDHHFAFVQHRTRRELKQHHRCVRVHSPHQLQLGVGQDL